MKQRHYLMLLGLAMALVFVRPAQAQLGVAVGLNFDDISDIDTGDREATFENATGWHVGLFYDIAFGPVGLRPGVIYRDMSQMQFQATGITSNFGFDASLIEIPIDVRLRLGAAPFIKPYALAAPVLSFVSNVDDEFKDEVEDFRLSADVGLGLEVSIPGLGLRLFPELRYSFGVSKFIDQTITVGGQEIRANDSGRLNAFMLRLGIGL